VTDGFQVNPSVLAQSSATASGLAERAESIASGLVGAFAQLEEAADSTVLTEALRDAAAETAQRMAEIITFFGQVGSTLAATAESYQNAENANVNKLAAIKEQP
jgi:uncharacterized protein YukE